MSITTRPLTATEVDKAKPKEKPYRLYDGGGLILNVATSGTKTWYLMQVAPQTATKKV
ncbi:integrase arm-type DNA-binding domain-containing protein [Faucicola mancuniensis]|uniref:integrase arm-type DNA-binding domain-containing protein n=1 Tax=Faucicola mancuniensis TaxID=1309795 RepID=UPI0039774300